MPSRERGHLSFFMSSIRGEGRSQGRRFQWSWMTSFRPIMCRVIDVFVDGLAMADMGFERAEAAETRRPGNDPRDLLKLYMYGSLNQLRSSRRLEVECRRSVD